MNFSLSSHSSMMARVSHLAGPGGLLRVRLPRALSPLRGAAAALWRPKCSRSRILSNRFRRSHPTRTAKTKKPRYHEALLVLVGPVGFEPPTSTMSRPIGRTKTRVDGLKLVLESFSVKQCGYGSGIKKRPSMERLVSLVTRTKNLNGGAKPPQLITPQATGKATEHFKHQICSQQ